MGDRDLVLVSGGVAVSSFGNSVSLLVLLLWAQGQSPLLVSGVLVAGMLPVALGAPLAGLLVDRLRNRGLMIAALMGQGAAVVTISTTLDRPAIVLCLLVVSGAGNAVVTPAGAALIPKIAGEDGATRGYSWFTTGRCFGLLAGSTAGALLVGTIGHSAALLVDAATFAVFAGLLCLVNADRDPERTERPSALAGLAYVKGDRVLLVSMVGLSCAVGCIVLINVAHPFFVVEVQHGNAFTMGALQAVWMVGVLAGVRLAARVTTQRQLVLALGLATVTQGLGVCLAAAHPAVAFSVVGFLIGGTSNGMENVTQQGLVRARTPDELRGRVFSAANAMVVAANLTGTAAAADVVAAVGPRWAFAIAGIGTVLSGLVTLTATRRTASPVHT